MLFAKGKGMWRRIRIFLILTVAAVMMAGCAAGEGGLSFTDGLAYDETDHAWTTEEEAFRKLVRIMRQECAAPDTASGVYLLATDDRIVLPQSGHNVKPGICIFAFFHVPHSRR